MNFEGKVILVTGSSRGIGAAIAKAFAAEGGSVVVNYLNNKAAATAVVESCKELGGDAVAIRADVGVEDDVKRLVENSLDDFGRIDVLVNNAFRPYAFDPETRKRFGELAWDDYQVQFDGAVRPAYLLCQALLPVFSKSAEGSVINMVSDLVERPVIAYHDYTTAKSALVGFTRNLAAELGPLGVRVNCVAPGLVWPTDASRATKESVKNDIVAQTPLRRVARPEDVTGPVLFLASQWSGFMTGQTLYVDGGLVMR
ncbi:MAG: 3-oxoacyl-[acyl-carrier protein] reductase [Gammaproteobacteria bacterium]|jgi:3-oxoacyl-[acyl-carrier protein] reductase